MAAEVERIRGAPGDEPSFRAYDLNQALDPTREMVCSPDDLRACFTEAPPPRGGPAFLGFDFGEATSATAAAAVWPETGRMETWMAFGDTPSLAERARRDDAPYAEMQGRGELTLHAGRIVPLDAFLRDVAHGLAGCEVAAAAADSYREAWRRFAAGPLRGFAALIEHECALKLDVDVRFDFEVLRAHDVVARATAFRRMVEGGMAMAAAAAASGVLVD